MSCTTSRPTRGEGTRQSPTTGHCASRARCVRASSRATMQRSSTTRRSGKTPCSRCPLPSITCRSSTCLARALRERRSAFLPRGSTAAPYRCWRYASVRLATIPLTKEQARGGCNQAQYLHGTCARRKRYASRAGTSRAGAPPAGTTRGTRRASPRAHPLSARHRAAALERAAFHRRSRTLRAQLPGRALLSHRRLPPPAWLGVSSLGIRADPAARLLGAPLHHLGLLAVRTRCAPGRLRVGARRYGCDSGEPLHRADTAGAVRSIRLKRSVGLVWRAKGYVPFARHLITAATY